MSARLPFNPGLNQVVIADLPGLPAGAAGSRVNQWLCSWAVGQRMAAVPQLLTAAVALAGGPERLQPLATVDVRPTATAELVLDGVRWPALLDSLVAQGHSSALALADDLGRVLGGLVATLVLGPPEARAGRPEWPDSEWGAWTRVRRVAVGGGVVSADLGVRMADAARALLATLSVAVDVERGREPSCSFSTGRQWAMSSRAYPPAWSSTAAGRRSSEQSPWRALFWRGPPRLLPVPTSRHTSCSTSWL